MSGRSDPNPAPEGSFFDIFKGFGTWISYGEEAPPCPPEIARWSGITGAASLIGFLAGGFSGKNLAQKQWLEANHDTIFENMWTLQKHRSYAGFLGYWRGGTRAGMQMGLLAGVFAAVQIGLERYRKREDFVNYTAAGFAAGSIFTVTQIGLLTQGLATVKEAIMTDEIRKSREAEKQYAEWRVAKEKEWREGISGQLVENLEHQLNLAKATPSRLPTPEEIEQITKEVMAKYGSKETKN
eukprot:Colp12_sorted_trinity150504_noHs@24995